MSLLEGCEVKKNEGQGIDCHDVAIALKETYKEAVESKACDGFDLPSGKHACRLGMKFLKESLEANLGVDMDKVKLDEEL